MATNTQIKSAIDLDITNKTLPKSIAHAKVGERIKDVVDYVDQEVFTVAHSLSAVATTGSYNDLTDLPSVSNSIIRMQATNIQSSQILDLHNTIVPIVTGETGKIKTILSYIIVYNYGTTTYTQTGSGLLGFHYGNYGSIGYMNAAFININESGTWQYYNLNSMGRMQYYLGDATIGLKLTSGNYADGDGEINVYVTYIETTL